MKKLVPLTLALALTLITDFTVRAACTASSDAQTPTTYGCPFLRKEQRWTVSWSSGSPSIQITENYGTGDCFLNQPGVDGSHGRECWPDFYEPAVRSWTTNGFAYAEWEQHVYDKKNGFGECVINGPVRIARTGAHTCGRDVANGGGNCTTPGFNGSCPPGTSPNGAGLCCPNPGTCNGPADWSSYPSTGCASGFVNSGGTCTRSSGFRTQCNRFGGYEPETCSCSGGCGDSGLCSPVLIDTAGDGLALTGAADGVNFDVGGNGTPERRAWTEVGSDDAWLALDRDGNGVIDGGRELFGNATAQPPPPDGAEMNGFLALAEYDRPWWGGNGDGWVGPRDAIFASLRLWRDTNHNGVSEAGELYGLASLGVLRLDLDYRESRRVDAHGNRFKYRAKVRDGRGAQVGRWAWDVFLVAAQ